MEKREESVTERDTILVSARRWSSHWRLEGRLGRKHDPLTLTERLRDPSLLEYLSIIVSRRESTVICQQDSIVKISISNDKN